MSELVIAGLPQLGIFKQDLEAKLPEFATESSACFDLRACISPSQVIKKRNGIDNLGITTTVGPERKIDLLPGDRVLVPTGLIFDIPVGYSVRLHPRSGLALKNGITLANAEGVIDADYVDPVFVLLINTSDKHFTVNHGDRVCQGELVKVEPLIITELNDAPLPKTNRNGGFGSTGI